MIEAEASRFTGAAIRYDATGAGGGSHTPGAWGPSGAAVRSAICSDGSHGSGHLDKKKRRRVRVVGGSQVSLKAWAGSSRAAAERQTLLDSTVDLAIPSAHSFAGPVCSTHEMDLYAVARG